MLGLVQPLPLRLLRLFGLRDETVIASRACAFESALQLRHRLAQPDHQRRLGDDHVARTCTGIAYSLFDRCEALLECTHALAGDVPDLLPLVVDGAQTVSSTLEVPAGVEGFGF